MLSVCRSARLSPPGTLVAPFCARVACLMQAVRRGWHRGRPRPYLGRLLTENNCFYTYRASYSCIFARIRRGRWPSFSVAVDLLLLALAVHGVRSVRWAVSAVASIRSRAGRLGCSPQRPGNGSTAQRGPVHPALPFCGRAQDGTPWGILVGRTAASRSTARALNRAGLLGGIERIEQF